MAQGIHSSRGATRIAAGAIVAAGALLVPAPALATVPVQTQDTAGCIVENAQLTWGVKESFRSYISGSIANGKWEVSDDMRYETPSFIWSKVNATVDPSLDSGSFAFEGAIHFTGHDGAMKLDVSDPVIEIAGDDVSLLLRVGSSDLTAGADGTVEATQVRAAKVDAAALSAGDGKIELTDAAVRLTADGAKALNGEYGSYVSGEELDPISMTAAVTGCELASQDATAPSEPTDEQAEAPGVTEGVLIQPEPQIPWLPIILGGVAILVIGVTGGMLLAGRKRGVGAEAGAAGEGADPEPSAQDPNRDPEQGN